jgi:hypothetical protein
MAGTLRDAQARVERAHGQTPGRPAFALRTHPRGPSDSVIWATSSTRCPGAIGSGALLAVLAPFGPPRLVTALAISPKSDHARDAV